MTKKIYIFDDDPDILELCKILLGSRGYQVFTAMDCNHIVEKLKDKMPDVVLMDNRIPESGGPEAIRLIRADETTRSIPILFFSANTNVEELSREAGADDFIQKPFDIGELEKIVHKYSGK